MPVFWGEMDRNYNLSFLSCCSGGQRVLPSKFRVEIGQVFENCLFAVVKFLGFFLIRCLKLEID